MEPPPDRKHNLSETMHLLANLGVIAVRGRSTRDANMTLEIPHMLASALIMWAVFWWRPRIGPFKEMAVGRQRLVQ
jgi:hypothetical protein